jgi:hypothetical protein
MTGLGKMYDVKLSRRLKLVNHQGNDDCPIALMMGTETVPETLDFNELTRLSAREEFINLGKMFVSLISENCGGF